MTRNEFLKEFGRIAKKYKFKVLNDQALRSSIYKASPYMSFRLLCPIEAVYYDKTEILTNWFEASRELGLTGKVTTHIVNSADHKVRTKLRCQLLEAIK